MTPPACESADVQADIVQEVVAFLNNEILNTPAPELGIDNQIISEGLIDSMGIVRLMTHLQKLYSIKNFNYSDMTLDNFRTIRNIAVMVARYR